MAKNKPVKKKENKPGKPQQPLPKKQPPLKAADSNKWLILCSVLAATFVAYLSAIHNDLTNWDDNRYIYDNPLVKSLSWNNIKHLFTFTTYVGGNYHPLAILSLAFDYDFYNLTPAGIPGSFEGTGYHLTSVIIHLLSVAVLFFFCWRLTKQVWVAAIAALLFGIHPMHVESVAWASERKDQLYVLFYFVALFFYIKYGQNQKDEKKISMPVIILSLIVPPLVILVYLKLLSSFYLLSAILFLISLILILTFQTQKSLPFYLLVTFSFILSLLSKGQGVTLPVVLLGIDYFVKRKWNWNMFIEKVPLLILSIFFGIVAVLAQKTSHSIQDIKIYPYLDRVMFACYALVGYLYKMILPIDLSAFYPYPVKTAGAYPPMIYISPFIILILLGLLVLTARKRLVAFGVLFFMANIILLLQLLPVGSAIMSDRYTYLAYTGLFFVFAVVVNNLIKNNSATAKSLRPLLFMGFFVYFGFLGITTYARNQVWQNSETLWSDVIKKEPRCGLAYNQLGSVLQKEGKNDIAFTYFKNAIGLQPDYPEAYVNQSDVYRVRGKLDSAINDCDTALKYRHNYPEAYVNRGIARAVAGQIDSAMNDFKHAVRLDHNLPNVYTNMGNVYDMKEKLDSAIFCYTTALALDPTQVGVYESRGRSYREKGSLDLALNDLNRSIQMNQSTMESYYQRSLVYNQKGNKKQALQDALTARSLGKHVDDSYINSLKAE